MSPIVALQAALAAFTAFYAGSWFMGAKRAPSDANAPVEAKTGGLPNAAQLGLGFITNFFDTLGIGSFAPTTASFKFFKMVPDRLIPGTLNVGHTLPTIVQAFIYTAAIDVDIKTLVLMIAASLIGAWFGAGIVARWPKRRVQLGMGLALMVAAMLFTRSQLTSAASPKVDGASQTGGELRTKDWRPATVVLHAGDVITMQGVNAYDAAGGKSTGRIVQFVVSSDVTSDADGKATIPVSPAIVTADAGRTVSESPKDADAVDVGPLGLSGTKLVIGVVGNMLLGALMTLGIGLYAPCMILVGLLGMNATTAFPIMMGSCAFLMPVSTARFVKEHAYSLRPALGLMIGGVPAVLIAAFLVTSLPLYWVKWLVVGVVTIAAAMMLRSASRGE